MRVVAVGLGVAFALTAAVAQAAFPLFGAHDVATLFFISKSDDRNRVDYWMKLDDHCRPLDADAIVPYWREFEKSPPVRTHSIGFLEKMAYGIAVQRIVSRTADGGDYFMRLKQVGRPMGIATRATAQGGCVAVVRMTIAGVTAELASIYVKL